jgi:hypothetical protein
MKLLIVLFLKSPVTSPLLGPNVLLSTLFLKTLSLGSSLHEQEEASNPYKIINKMKLLFILLYLVLDGRRLGKGLLNRMVANVPRELI